MTVSNSPMRMAVLLLVLMILAIYYPLPKYDFILIDDHQFVVDNPHIQRPMNLECIGALFTGKILELWVPLTQLSFMLDYHVYGLNPGGFHFTNLMLHIASTVLLFIFFQSVTGCFEQSLAIAVLFGIHPLNVETVAWITDRKDVLSTFFCMLMLIAYGKYVKRRSLYYYLLTLLLFVAALMSKPNMVVMPFALLLLDYWPLARIQVPFQSDTPWRLGDWIKVVVEKGPFFLCSLTISWVTYDAYNIISFDTISLTNRIQNCILAYALYVKRLFLPFNLAMFYPHPLNSISLAALASAMVFLMAITVWAIISWRRHPYLIVGWLWFLGTLVPTIGIIKGGWPIAMADRYAYIPFIGLYVMAVWYFPTLLGPWRYRRHAITTICAVAMIGLMVFAGMQVRFWSDSYTLFKHTVEVTSNNYITHYNLGYYLSSIGKDDKALVHYREAIRIKPNYSKAYNNIGIIFVERGNYKAALSAFAKAHYYHPQALDILKNLKRCQADIGNQGAAQTP